MKQSTKLLSLLLALIMAFSCMSVIGNAALVKAEVSYDSIDDAMIHPEQVADIALDLVDNLLVEADMDPVDLSIVGELRFDSIDHILYDICSLRDNILWGIAAGLLGSIGDLDFDPLLQSGSFGLLSSHTAYQRSHGDLEVIGALLEFIGNDNNAGKLSAAAYGIGTDNGVDLGLIGSFLDLGDIGDSLSNIPLMLTELVYDLLVYGSYNSSYENESYPSVDDLKAEGKSLPTDMDTFDEMVDNALLNLLINPQEYDWEDQNGDESDGKEYKNWDEKAVILPSAKGNLTTSQISPRINSFFAILDTVAPYAINDIGINALNNNLKKALMEAVEIDLNEINEADLPGYIDDTSVEAGSVAADFEILAKDGEETYVTYIAYDRMAKDGADYYYTTMETEIVDENNDGVQDTDPETEEPLSKKVRKFYKANMTSGNDFASLIDWSWKFVGDNVTPEDGQTQLVYNNIKKDYDGDGTASIVEGINDLLYLVYNTALNGTVKADFAAFVAEVDSATAANAACKDGYLTGANANLMTNVENITKFILVNFGDLVFGSTSPYAKLTVDDVKDLDVIDLVVMIGPGFFEDVMPQLIMPKNEDGTYAFHDPVQIYEFGALVIREFVTDIAPNLADMNYDAYIFEEGVDSANDRQFKVQGAEQWTNLILNMGMDIAYTYLYNLTNFGDTFTYSASYTAGQKNVTVSNREATYPEVTDSNVYDESRWSVMLDEVIIWAAEYVGNMKSSSVLAGFEPNTISGKGSDYAGTARSPLTKLSYVLNTLLPLGFVNGFESTEYAFDIYNFFENGLKAFLSDFDLSRVLGLLGRNMSATHYNLLADSNLVNGVLNLVNGILNLVFGKTILNGVNATNSGTTQSIDTVISQANLQTTIKNLLTGLYGRKDAILLNALPVVAKLIKGWGTEQAYKTPEVSFGNSFDLTDGKTSAAQSVTVRNASEGVWRHYRDEDGTSHQDEQYKIKLTAVRAYDQMGTGASAYVTPTLGTQGVVDYGAATTFTFNVNTAIPKEGFLVRFEIDYLVYDENGDAMAGGDSFTVSKYVWLNYNPDDNGATVESSGNDRYARLFTPHYVALETAVETIPELRTAYVESNKVNNGPDTTLSFTNNSGTVDGITFGNFSQKFANGNEKRYADLYNFKTSTFFFKNEDGDDSSDEYTISGSLNEATWKAANKQPGSNTTFNIAIGNDAASTVNTQMKIIYFSQEDYNKLSSLAKDELSATRLASNHNTSGKYYADGILTSANSVDAADETVYRQTNSTTTAWIADEDAGQWYGSYTNSAGTTVTTTATTYEDNQVTDIVTTEDEDGNVTAMTGKVGDVDVKKVTVIDGATATSAYVSAFLAGAKEGVGAKNLNASNNFDYIGLYEALYVASKDMAVFKKSSEQLVDEGQGSAIDSTVAALKTQLREVEAATTDRRNYTDYKMWRLNRLNDAREDAQYYVDLYKDSLRVITDVDSRFPYNGMIEKDLKDVVSNNTAVLGQRGGTDNANLVEALLVAMEEEELKAQTEWLENRHKEYSEQEIIDVEMASNALINTSDRLLAKYERVYDDYLSLELTSAEVMIGDENGEFTDAIKAQYTERSWAKFENAYNEAIALYDEEEMTQKEIFEAKYELMTCRNELVLVEDEADYSELEALMKQAKFALDPANIGLYDNTAEELGQVLAELGICEYNAETGKFTLVEVTHPDGYGVDLFPGSAAYINTEPYSKDDQDVVDQKATELKEALARLKFKGLDIGATEGKNVEIDTGILVEGDEENNIEAVTATIAKIAAKTDAEAVKALFSVTADGATVGVDNITVSNDLHYTVDTDLDGFAGTNSVVTFYTVADGVKIPVATVRIVVDGDINGDGTVDGIDASQAFLVANDFAEIDGCYLLAGDLVNSDREVDSGDYGQIINTYFGQTVK